MPAFLGLLTTLGPAVTGAALVISQVHPTQARPYDPEAWKGCVYVLGFSASGARLTGFCEGPLAGGWWLTPPPTEPSPGRRYLPPSPVYRPPAPVGASVSGTDVPEGAWPPDPPTGDAGEEEAGAGHAGARKLEAGVEQAGVREEEAGGRQAGVGEEDRGGADMGAVDEARRQGREKGAGARKARLPGEVAADAALSRLGTPFSWGGGSVAGPTKGVGRGARTSGFDCSGLTLYAWAKAGVKLGHYTGTQFRQGRRIAWGQWRAGDLVFFGGGRGDPTHVGLYLRDGVMVHAPKTGDVVKKTDFAGSPYYRTRYRGAVRPWVADARDG